MSNGAKTRWGCYGMLKYGAGIYRNLAEAHCVRLRAQVVARLAELKEEQERLALDSFTPTGKPN